MSLFKKPSQIVAGTKFLFFGDTGSGKSIAGLSFPKLFVIDSEAGITYYQNHPEYGKNILGIANTQNFNKLLEAYDEVGEMIEEDPNSVKTLVVDSITKISNNLNDTVLQVEERKARRKGNDPDDSAISIRGYGRIKNIGIRIQNAMIDLSSKGCNIVFIAQDKPIKKKVGDQFVVVGHEPDSFKQSAFDFDVIVRTYTQIDQSTGEVTYLGEVLKDRTNVCKRGQVIENVSYNIWKEFLEGSNVGNINTSFSKDLDKAKETLEKQDEEEEKTTVDKFRESMNTATEEQKKQVIEMISKYKIKNPLDPKDPKEFKALEEIVKTVFEK